MIIKKAYKFKLKTNAVQRHEFAKYAGHCRFIWNKFLRLNLDRLRAKQKMLWYNEMSFWLTLWKSSDEYSFLKEAHSQVLQAKLKDLEKAFKDAFDKKQPLKRMPKMRKRLTHDSFRFPQASSVVIEGNRVKLPKLGWVRLYKSQDVKGKLKNITISQRSGNWYISMQVEQEIDLKKHASSSEVAIDLGVKKFATMSNGESIDAIDIYQSSSKKLASLQRKLRLKKKFSNNWRRVTAKIAKLHSKIAFTRGDFLHKASSNISKSHAVVYIGDLRVRNMSASARGDLESPGKNVKAKSGLNKAILDQGWGEFVRQLEYKTKWQAGKLVLVSERYTSQTCSSCGYRDAANRKTQANFECLDCGYKENADINGAKNILTVGQTGIACGERALARSMKQEPLQTRECTA